MATQNGASIIGWSALVIALIALALAWTAFNRTGTDIEALVQQEIDEATADLRTDYEDLEAEFRAETSDELQDAASDVQTDQSPTTTGE